MGVLRYASGLRRKAARGMPMLHCVNAGYAALRRSGIRPMAYARPVGPTIGAMSSSTAPPDDSHVRPFVREALDSQSMHFSDSAIQSRMQLQQPDALALEYTRTMMGFLMFEPKPAQVAMIGLGGGSLAKFCHRHLPRT